MCIRDRFIIGSGWSLPSLFNKRNVPVRSVISMPPSGRAAIPHGMLKPCATVSITKFCLSEFTVWPDTAALKNSVADRQTAIEKVRQNSAGVLELQRAKCCKVEYVIDVIPRWLTVFVWQCTHCHTAKKRLSDYTACHLNSSVIRYHQEALKRQCGWHCPLWFFIC